MQKAIAAMKLYTLKVIVFTKKELGNDSLYRRQKDKKVSVYYDIFIKSSHGSKNLLSNK